MRKPFILLIVLGAMTFLSWARSEPQGSGSKKLTIAVIPKSTAHGFWKNVHAGSIKTAQELSAQGTGG